MKDWIKYVRVYYGYQLVAFLYFYYSELEIIQTVAEYGKTQSMTLGEVSIIFLISYMHFYCF